jgi:hypothetical protein
MSGLDTDIVVHKVPLVERCRPVKQKLRKTYPDVLVKVKAEIKKQWNTDFFLYINS